MGFEKGTYRIQNEKSKEYVTLAENKNEEGTRLATTNNVTDENTKWILKPTNVDHRPDYYAIQTGAGKCHAGLLLQFSVDKMSDRKKGGPVTMDYNPGPYDVALTSKATHVFHISQRGSVYLISAFGSGPHWGLGKELAEKTGHAVAMNEDTTNDENHWKIEKVDVVSQLRDAIEHVVL
ncbi:uncharacterized protein LAESUDRAFT_720868 [Laetiporus sulphureus 93-53]|uniref:Ricin B lectin domain-containing protein n=1 Tax=Laetiporus sulphureus 93-53 TaxID=1314785 RepID=A0A165HE78_9APHY|nr:uncharacterized protein LAESUDRAFT_720868 [Laetiporus sulphureus 93-53]KZT11618.1 hypothetical protein LAESUDRAFT_720868 [Laetiporus sulphureus 93-53]